MGYTGEFAIWDDSFATTADLRTRQFCAVTRSAEGVVSLAGAGEAAVGILQNAPNASACEVRRLGASYAIVNGAGTAVAVGDPLKCGASGTLVKATSASDWVVARAEQASTTATAQIIVSLTGGNALGDVPALASLTETHTAASFTDGVGTAVGTKSFTGQIPAGAVLMGTKVLVPAGFAGDVSAALTIGDGSDVDRCNTGTPSIFATAATGVEMGVPSGAKLVLTAFTPVLTVTSNADFTPVLSGGGSIVVSIFYLKTV